jgi:flavin reductase (DIM6/NTAB) family NADH-FMN oxidoreductase RutF
MKKEEPIRMGLRQLPIRPVYLVSTEYEGKRNIITIGMFGFFSGTPSLVGIGIAPKRYSYDLIHTRIRRQCR